MVGIEFRQSAKLNRAVIKVKENLLFGLQSQDGVQEQCYLEYSAREIEVVLVQGKRDDCLHPQEHEHFDILIHVIPEYYVPKQSFVLYIQVSCIKQTKPLKTSQEQYKTYTAKVNKYEDFAAVFCCYLVCPTVVK